MTACKTSNRGSQLQERLDAENQYFAVGLVTYENGHRCTATVIKHGVALTAKHCFQATEIKEVNLRKIGLNFRYASASDSKPVFVRGPEIKKVVFDGSSNDIAYILYEPAATSRLRLDLPLASQPSSPRQGAATVIVGYPVEEKADPQFPKVVSKACSFTGKSGTIPPADDGNVYDGRLFETSCEGWWGMSGGPALAFTATGAAEVIGVVAHTFHPTEGDQAPIKKDAFGKYVPDVAISPLSQAEQLGKVLALNVEALPTPKPVDFRSLCGYDSAAALLVEASNALEVLKNSASFDPTFWLEAGPTKDQRILIKKLITEQNASYKGQRKTAETSLPWAKAVFADYDALLNLPSLAKFKNLGIASLGVTDSYQECDALGCTTYSEFLVRMNKGEVQALFARQPQEVARKAMKGILGHELGHYVMDFYLLNGKGYTSLKKAHEDTGSLKYHLTVDAIGMVLAGYSPSEFRVILSEANSQVFGDPRLAGDLDDRVACLGQLK